MHSFIAISESALLDNFALFSKLVGEQKLCPVIKSNAYGHGLKECTQILTKAKVAWLGVNYLYEAQKLRDFGYKGRILVVGPVFKNDYEIASQIKADVFLGGPKQLEWWLDLQKKPNIHIKVDTGLNRQGFFLEDLEKVFFSLKDYKSFVKGLCMHFSNVEDVTSYDYANLQLDRFKQAQNKAEDCGFKNLMSHAASSASTLLLYQSHFDLVRVGISMYGMWPSALARVSYLQTYQKLLDLKPVLSWMSKVAFVKQVTKGAYIGYGCTYKAGHDMKIAVVPIGYYEGYPRVVGNKQSYVLIQGARCQIVGRICMNMMMVDISHLPHVEVEDRVTLIGKDGDECISANDIAHWSESISYEIFSRINPEIPRVVI